MPGIVTKYSLWLNVLPAIMQKTWLTPTETLLIWTEPQGSNKVEGWACPSIYTACPATKLDSDLTITVQVVGVGGGGGGGVTPMQPT